MNDGSNFRRYFLNLLMNECSFSGQVKKGEVEKLITLQRCEAEGIQSMTKNGIDQDTYLGSMQVTGYCSQRM